MLITEQLMDPIDFHCIFYPIMGSINYLVTHILQNIFFLCSTEDRTHTGLDQLEMGSK